MATVFANKRVSLYFHDLDCRFLEKSLRITVSILVATEYEAESNDCLCIVSVMVFANKRASFYFHDFDCRFLEKLVRIIVNNSFYLAATESEAESNDCVCIISACSQH